ncbi:MAG: DUF5777 family beta-barrel protein [Cyclobacteriaceae bacterium]
MKTKMITTLTVIKKGWIATLILTILCSGGAWAQDEGEDATSERTPARPAFESAQLLDMQSVVVPSKGTLEFDIQHRFGLVENGISDLYGLYAPSNIRMGFTYAPINNLSLGFGFAKFKKYLDFNAKYAILKQSRDGAIPVSVTYFGDVAVDTRAPENFSESVHRLSYYNELIIARRITSKISLQLSPSFSHFNATDSLYKHDVIALGVGARYKFSSQSSIVINYVHQFTTHDDPDFELQPNISIGWEIATSSHAFQIFITSFQSIIYQENISYNTNDFLKGDIAIGFNITRLWNF